MTTTLAAPGARTRRPAAEPAAQIPASHRDLAECPPVAALSTVTAEGYPQTSVVWCDVEGACVRVNTMHGFAKERNMRRNPLVTLLCYDPQEPLRSLEIRGTVIEQTEVGAWAHLDAIASKYCGRPVRYFGDVVPAGFAETEEPVLCRIRPDRVVALDARPAASEPRPATDPPIPASRTAPERPAGTTAGADVSRAEEAIPPSHRDLFERPVIAVLTTMGAEGRPESSLVWADLDGSCPRVNTTLERRKGRNLLRDRRVSLLVVDPDDTSRFIQVRGDADLVHEGAIEHLDALTRRYTRHPAFYGSVYPTSQRERETRVIVRIHPRRVTLDAIHR